MPAVDHDSDRPSLADRNLTETRDSESDQVQLTIADSEAQCRAVTR